MRLNQHLYGLRYGPRDVRCPPPAEPPGRGATSVRCRHRVARRPV